MSQTHTLVVTTASGNAYVLAAQPGDTYHLHDMRYEHAEPNVRIIAPRIGEPLVAYSIDPTADEPGKQVLRSTPVQMILRLDWHGNALLPDAL